MELQPLVNPALQMQGILHNPLVFLSALFNSLYSNNFYTQSIIGDFGWVNYSYTAIVYSVYFLIFGYVIREIISYKRKIFPSYVTLILFFICCAAFLLPFVAMYIFWTPVGYTQILGVQGRYFLVLLPFVLLIIHQLFISVSKWKVEKALMWFVVLFISLQSLMTVYLRYYQETVKEDTLAGLIKYDPMKIKYMPIDKQTFFNFKINNRLKEITGFQFYFTTLGQKTTVSYRYKLLDKSCKKIIRQGDIDIRKLEKDALYQESFAAIVVKESSICMILEPSSVSFENHYISLVTNDQTTVIKLIGNTE